tara:strand:- start:2488 stop:5565 length:3078 start_codon:yes stop_codon:yes gene_type:complete
MAKKIYKIEAFEGGINQLADPRDIEDNQFEELFNADVSHKGRITLPGNALQVYSTVNSKDLTVTPEAESSSLENPTGGLTPGYGLYAFSHDFNMQGLGDEETYPIFKPGELDTEFICINDGAHIDIWDSCHQFSGGTIFYDSGHARWIQSAIKMGEVHLNSNGKKVKPIYYKADNGVRVCDANFGQQLVPTGLDEALTVTETTITVESGPTFNAGEYIKINSEIIKIISISSNVLTVLRAQFGTYAETHTDEDDIYEINVPKILTHINQPLLKKADGTTAANTIVNRWVEDIQFPEPPSLGDFVFKQTSLIGVSNDGTTMLADSIYPDVPEKVFLGVKSVGGSGVQVGLHATALQIEQTSTECIVTITIADPSSPYAKISAFGTELSSGIVNLSIGMALIIEGASGDQTALNGVHEIVGFGDEIGEVKIICEEPQDITAPEEGCILARVEEELMSDDLKNKYILGMSYLYDGGGNTLQESSVTTAVTSYSSPVYLVGIFGLSTFSFGLTSANWYTANSSLASETALDITLSDFDASNGWQYTPSTVTHSGGTATYLYMKHPTKTVSVNTEYGVHIETLAMSGSDKLEVWVGVGPGDGVDHTDGSLFVEGTHKKTITTGGEHNFILKTHASDIDEDVLITFRGTDGFELKQVEVTDGASIDTIMSQDNNIDLRPSSASPSAGLSFLCNNSRSGSAQNNSWNERIEGFRIYMKQVDMIGGGLAEEWLLFYDVNIKNGTYVCHTTDGDIQNLQLTNVSGALWDASSGTDANSLVATRILGDSINSLPLLSYETENGYKADTNLAAMYKASAIVERKVYIGNLKIGERTYPDRMIRADADRFDSFPDDGTHYIDVATSDGDSIVKLESLGNKLLQFKKKTAYLINVTSEGEELANTWPGAGVLSPSQVVKTRNGIVWVNDNGLYLYNGEELQHITEDRFSSDGWAINENEDTPVLVGYDEKSNKVIIQTLNTAETAHGGFIYDMSTGAITQSQKLFNWYMTYHHIDPVGKNNPIIGPPINVTPGEGPTS